MACPPSPSLKTIGSRAVCDSELSWVIVLCFSSNHSLKERSLTSLSLQVKKSKLRGAKLSGRDQKDPARCREREEPLDRSPSLQKISPLQHYILEQAKLSGYRFGDKIQTEKRDSFIDSENESHRTGE